MTHKELARIALRYDTQISTAMLKALGIERPRPLRKRGRATKRGDSYKFSGTRKLMNQKHGVDLRK